MDTNQTLNQEFLLNAFEYKNGEIYWKTKISRIVKVGKKAGSFDAKGYKEVGIQGKSYKVHRVIFMMFNGYLPKELDHIDGNRSNNCIENLRDATSSQNNYNQKLKSNNTSGYKGVSWCKYKEKWTVRVTTNKKVKQVGYFDDLELASLVAIEARNKYHSEYARHF